MLAPLRLALGLSGGEVLSYQDLHRGRQRLLRLGRDAAGHEHMQGFWIAGDATGEAWLRALLEADEQLPMPGRNLLAPHAQKMVSVAPRSPQVCACFNVSEAAIRTQLTGCQGSPDARLAQLQSALRCGTQCGSCLPKLRTLVKAVEPTASIPSGENAVPAS